MSDHMQKMDHMLSRLDDHMQKMDQEFSNIKSTLIKLMDKMGIPTDEYKNSEESTVRNEIDCGTTQLKKEGFDQDNQEVTTTIEFIRFLKEDFPCFFEGDLEEWMRQCDRLFVLEETPENIKRRWVIVCLKGNALEWHNNFLRNNNDTIDELHWMDYLRMVFKNFESAPKVFDEMPNKFENKIQDSSDNEVLEIQKEVVDNINLGDDLHKMDNNSEGFGIYNDTFENYQHLDQTLNQDRKVELVLIDQELMKKISVPLHVLDVTEMNPQEKQLGNTVHGKMLISVLLDQGKMGEYVSVLDLTKEFSSGKKKKKQLNWTDTGWVCVEDIATKGVKHEIDEVLIDKLQGNVEIVKVLLDRGADVNLKNNSDRTALHYATSNGWVKLAEILLSKGAKVNSKAARLGSTAAGAALLVSKAAGLGSKTAGAAEVLLKAAMAAELVSRTADGLGSRLAAAAQWVSRAVQSVFALEQLMGQDGSVLVFDTCD